MAGVGFREWSVVINFDYQLEVMNIVLVLLAVVLWTARSATYPKLESPTQLFNGDEIVSTLGTFKLILSANDCALNLQSFDKATSIYTTSNRKFQGNYQGSCAYLKIVDNKILANGSNVFWQLSTSNLSKAYLSIDDNAVIRFVGLKNPNGNPSPSDFQQIKFDNFSQPQTFYSILDSFQTISMGFSQKSNGKNWSFAINNDQLTISSSNNIILQTFNIPKAYFAISGIFDEQNETLPYALFEGINFQTVCGVEKGRLIGPFVLAVDQYWPTMAIYDQQGFKVFEWSLNAQEGTSNPCPRYTFSKDLQCLAVCPSPYYHQIEGDRGKCVLNCQFGSKIDVVKRVCECKSRVNSIAPSYTCLKSNSYYFGCYCNNNTYFERRSQKCVSNCTNGLQIKGGVCLNCSRNCVFCSMNSNGVQFVTCYSCYSGYTLYQGYCVESSNCPQNCLICNNAGCLACKPFFTLSSNQCLQSCPNGAQLTSQSNFTYICSKNSLPSCPDNCLNCRSTNNSICQICKPGYTLLITPISVTCRKQSFTFSCSSAFYVFIPQYNVCYNNQSTAMASMTSCLKSIVRCLVCAYQSTQICLVCSNGFLLQQNLCVSTCSPGYFRINQGCSKGIDKCLLNSFYSGKLMTSLTLNTVTKNTIYLNYINQGTEVTNDYYGYQLYARYYHMFINDTSSINSKLWWTKPICSQCQTGYGLNQNSTACLPCPTGCLLCYYADNGSCLAKTSEEVLTYTLGSSISSCGSFLSSDYVCLKSCPENSSPVYNTNYSKLTCVATSDSEGQKYLKIDGSTFAVSSNQFIHKFVFSQQISTKLVRLLQSGIENMTIDASGNSVTITSSRQTQVLNLNGKLSKFESIGGLYPVNTIYGINQQLSFKTYIKKWLAIIGYIFSIAIILIHCIYIGNNFLYKMDNLIIFCQTIFFFLFNRIIVGNPIAQFYYGWSWVHLNFYPNYFEPELKYTEPTITPYALYNLDANFIRNAGSSISLLVTFLLIWAIASIIIYIVDTFFGRNQLWYYRISKNALIAALQFFSYNIFYWCIAFINYDKNYLTEGTFVGLSVLFLISTICYTLGRIYFNPIGGIYMVKRVVYASILASSYQRPGFAGLIVVIELIFAGVRTIIEKPKKKRDLLLLWVEQGSIIIFMIILYTVTNASVVSILTTIFIYIWFLSFVADLADIYLAAKNKVYDLSCFKNIFQGDNSGVKSSEQNEPDNDHGHTDRPFQSKLES